MSEEKVGKFVLDDTVYETIITSKFANRKQYKPFDPNRIVAYIPGTIREIYITANQRVKKGEKLLILEAMKMRNTIVAPKDGTIKTLDVRTGQSVAKNDLMIEMD